MLLFSFKHKLLLKIDHINLIFKFCVMFSFKTRRKSYFIFLDFVFLLYTFVCYKMAVIKCKKAFKELFWSAIFSQINELHKGRGSVKIWLYMYTHMYLLWLKNSNKLAFLISIYVFVQKFNRGWEVTYEKQWLKTHIFNSK